MPTSAETPEVLPHSLPGLGRHHCHCGVTFPGHTSTELRHYQVSHCWVHTRLAVFSGGTADTGLSAVLEIGRAHV